jgi:hypothetical protein
MLPWVGADDGAYVVGGGEDGARDKVILSKSMMSCSFEVVLIGAGGSGRANALDGIEVEVSGTYGVVLLVFIDPEFSLEPIVASLEVADCVLECLP